MVPFTVSSRVVRPRLLEVGVWRLVVFEPAVYTRAVVGGREASKG
jgi:hypothetical protein